MGAAGARRRSHLQLFRSTHRPRQNIRQQQHRQPCEQEFPPEGTSAIMSSGILPFNQELSQPSTLHQVSEVVGDCEMPVLGRRDYRAPETR